MKKTIKFTSKKNAPITAHSKRFTGPTMDSTSELKPSNTLATESRIHELKQRLGCPYDCGICPKHKSQTVLAIIDVTNRCNLRCPVCFATAGTTGYVYEPTKEQIEAMLVNLRSNKPVPVDALQFSGGEPTIREDLPGAREDGERTGHKTHRSQH